MMSAQSTATVATALLAKIPDAKRRDKLATALDVAQEIVVSAAATGYRTPAIHISHNFLGAEEFNGKTVPHVLKVFVAQGAQMPTVEKLDPQTAYVTIASYNVVPPPCEKRLGFGSNYVGFDTQADQMFANQWHSQKLAHAAVQ